MNLMFFMIAIGWECYIGYNGERYDITWDLDANTLTEAIIETFKELDEIYGFLKKIICNAKEGLTT